MDATDPAVPAVPAVPADPADPAVPAVPVGPALGQSVPRSVVPTAGVPSTTSPPDYPTTTVPSAAPPSVPNLVPSAPDDLPTPSATVHYAAPPTRTSETPHTPDSAPEQPAALPDVPPPHDDLGRKGSHWLRRLFSPVFILGVLCVVLLILLFLQRRKCAACPPVSSAVSSVVSNDAKLSTQAAVEMKWTATRPPTESDRIVFLDTSSPERSITCRADRLFAIDKQVELKLTGGPFVSRVTMHGARQHVCSVKTDSRVTLGDEAVVCEPNTKEKKDQAPSPPEGACVLTG